MVRPCLLAVPLALTLAACAADADTQDQRPSDFVRVIDGDTLEIEGEVVRLSNIDAPELPPSSECWAEAALAVVSADQLRGLVASARTIEVHREGQDRYGRTLAKVTLDQRIDVGDGLVNLALAARWTGKKWDWCADPDLMDIDGPRLNRGPEQTAPFAAFNAKREAKALERDYPAPPP